LQEELGDDSEEGEEYRPQRLWHPAFGGFSVSACPLQLMGVAGKVGESMREMTGWEIGGLRTALVS
jgi:hypothetical protein